MSSPTETSFKELLGPDCRLQNNELGETAKLGDDFLNTAFECQCFRSVLEMNFGTPD